MSKLSKLDISAEEMKASQIDVGKLDGMKLKARIDEIVKKHVERAKAALASAGAAVSKNKKKAMAIGAAVLVAGTMVACTPTKEQPKTTQSPSISSEQPIEATPSAEGRTLPENASEVQKETYDTLVREVGRACETEKCTSEEIEEHLQWAIDAYIEAIENTTAKPDNKLAHETFASEVKDDLRTKHRERNDERAGIK